MKTRKKQEKSKLRRGTASFRPRARIIRTIGRDLITNEVIAIQELVKNAYDADASTVKLTFEEPLRPGEGAIILEDNGTGMDLGTVRAAWMEPATISKVHRKTTKRGRRVTGEKGIGRFASARVARILELTSVSAKTRKQVQVRFDWGVFDDEERYLDQVKCKWTERTVSRKERTGTTLRLELLNDEWKEDDEKKSFTALRAELSRLISPLAPPKDFAITLTLPDRFSALAGPITPPPVLARPHYKLSGSVDGSGTVTATYEGPGETGPVLADDGEKPKIILKGGRVPTCGAFNFEFRVWDRSPDQMEVLSEETGSTVSDLKEDLNAAAGVSIYRDGFRVLLPQDDWLHLDLRRIQSPVMRISNNQIVGMVSVSADGNRGLRDQTNRQGIVDSPAFADFKAALKDLIVQLEVKRDKSRRGKRPATATAGLFQELDLQPIRTFVEARYPEDKDLKKFFEDTQEKFSHGVGELKQVLSRYRRLATLGQLVDVILHEGRTPVAAISNEAQLIRKDLGKRSPNEVCESLPSRLKAISQQTEILTSLFKRISPFSGRKRSSSTETTIEAIIRSTFAIHEKLIQKNGVRVKLPDTSTPLMADEAELQILLMNLLENALYWLEKVPEDKREIVVQVQRHPQQLEITFSDSGPGVPEDIQDRIFDPYFSSKPDGVGLGLTIAGEIASERDGRLELLADGPLSGATFRIVLALQGGAKNG